MKPDKFVLNSLPGRVLAAKCHGVLVYHGANIIGNMGMEKRKKNAPVQLSQVLKH